MCLETLIIWLLLEKDHQQTQNLIWTSTQQTAAHAKQKPKINGYSQLDIL
jgi:hypothetical protein